MERIAHCAGLVAESVGREIWRPSPLRRNPRQTEPTKRGTKELGARSEIRGNATSKCPNRIKPHPKNLCSSVKSVVKKFSFPNLLLNRYMNLTAEGDGVGDGLDDAHVLQALGKTGLRFDAGRGADSGDKIFFDPPALL
jgi:hypothetical protein